MSMYKCIIVDDEPHSVEGLINYIERLPNIEIRATYYNPIIALSEILKQPAVDLILMDINMPEMSGIELSKAIRQKTSKLVFTTAHSKHGYEAFEVQADGYLLKPYGFEKFALIIDRLFPEVEAVQESERFFFIKSGDAGDFKIIKVMFDELIAIESKLNYIQIHTKNNSIMAYMSLSEIGTKLKNIPDLIRFQRSFIVNKARIDHIDGNIIKMDNNLAITVGDYYKKSFAEFVSKNLIRANRKK